MTSEYRCETAEDVYNMTNICLSNQTIPKDCFPGTFLQKTAVSSVTRFRAI